MVPFFKFKKKREKKMKIEKVKKIYKKSGLKIENRKKFKNTKAVLKSRKLNHMKNWIN